MEGTTMNDSKKIYGYFELPAEARKNARWSFIKRGWSGTEEKSLELACDIQCSLLDHKIENEWTYYFEDEFAGTYSIKFTDKFIQTLIPDEDEGSTETVNLMPTISMEQEIKPMLQIYCPGLVMKIDEVLKEAKDAANKILQSTKTGKIGKREAKAQLESALKNATVQFKVNVVNDIEDELKELEEIGDPAYFYEDGSLAE